jgi:hypothetical protein
MNDAQHFITEFAKRKIQYDGVCNSLIRRINDGSYKQQMDVVSGDFPYLPLSVEEVEAWKRVARVDLFTNQPTGLIGEMLEAYENGKKVEHVEKTLPIRKYLLEGLGYEIAQCNELKKPGKERRAFKGRKENLNRIIEMIDIHLNDDEGGEFQMLKGLSESVKDLLKSIEESTSKVIDSHLDKNIQAVQKGLEEIDIKDIFGGSATDYVEDAPVTPTAPSVEIKMDLADDEEPDFSTIL